MIPSIFAISKVKIEVINNLLTIKKTNENENKK